jgi:TRAP-type C4-dicarboxylate transport system substrate-binding protein
VQPGDVIELKLSHIMSPTANSHFLYQYLADEIYERTNGRVVISVFSGGQLNEVKQAFDAVRTGTADIVHHSTSMTAGMQPSVESLVLPCAAKNSWVADKLAADFASHFKVQDLKEFEDVHFLSFAGPSGPSYLFTQKPVNSTADVEGLRLIGAGMRARVQEMWGATNVSLAPPEFYEALDKGIVDGGLLPAEIIQSMRVGEVVEYMTVTPGLIYGTSMLLMNENKWNALPKDIQQVFNETMEDFSDWDGKVWWHADLVALEYFLSLPGREILELPAGAVVEFESALQPIIDDYVAEKTALGLEAAEYVEYIKERSEYWNGKIPDEQDTLDWVNKEILKQ